jgi:hypothetical protein
VLPYLLLAFVAEYKLYRSKHCRKGKSVPSR